MISTHITLLAEFGWIVGWAWFAFIGLALSGVRESPRVGISFAGLVLSGCSSTVFDWPVLFDVHDFGELGAVNWVLSWAMLVLFLGYGMWLAGGVWGRTRRRASLPAWGAAGVASAGALALAAWLVPPGNAPVVRDGSAIRGDAPRTLALYDGSWRLRDVVSRVGGEALVVPVRPAARFPDGIDLAGIGRVALFGTCREWAHLVKGVPVSCVGN